MATSTSENVHPHGTVGDPMYLGDRAHLQKAISAQEHCKVVFHNLEEMLGPGFKRARIAMDKAGQALHSCVIDHLIKCMPETLQEQKAELDEQSA